MTRIFFQMRRLGLLASGCFGALTLCANEPVAAPHAPEAHPPAPHETPAAEPHTETHPVPVEHAEHAEPKIEHEAKAKTEPEVLATEPPGRADSIPAKLAEHGEPKTEREVQAKTMPKVTTLVTGTNESAASGHSAGHTNGEAEYVPPTRMDQLNYALSLARFLTTTREYPLAEKNYERLLAADVPEALQQTALFEMALLVQTENDLPRAQSMLEQYLQHWPGDVRSPEIFLHQGRIFRQMGLFTYALSKFYSVSSSALSLKNDQLPYYKKLVLTAQLEIAETEFGQGHYQGAAEFYTRLLAQNAPGLDRAAVQFRLVRALNALRRHGETVQQAKDFLGRYPDSLDEPEARYYLAQALKGQNRNADALQQVMIFLHEQREKTKDRPEVWAYWQQRVGNEIGNQLYQDGDYIRALEVYLALSKLDGAAGWQLPVRYQVGITYEKLLQPRLAAVAYRAVTNSAPPLGTNLTPGLKSVVDMAQWRLDFLQWQERAEDFTRPREKIPASTNLDLSRK